MAKRLTEADLQRLQQAGTIKGYQVKQACTKNGKKKKVRTKGAGKQPQPTPAAVRKILEVLNTTGMTYSVEFRFHHKRKFRFDFAIVDLKIGIEYEGLMSEKSRHTTVTGYTRDSTKYNLAQSLGWKVFRYTALNYEQFESDLRQLLSFEQAADDSNEKNY